MSEKRALIVDDSKSARVVLSRLLEKYDLAVDTSDSAEQALEYLKARRPDVIFMDHLMHGMDGLQAVQAIRSNPETAAIPIMMYTSQEGEVYLGEALARGATGVLAKRIGSGEVSRILQDLKLLPPAGERVDAAPAATVGSASGPIIVATPGAQDAPADPGPTAPAPPSADDLRVALEPLLKQHSAELRRFVVASLESFAARVVTDTRELVQAAVAAIPAPVVVPAPVPEPPPPPPRPTGWIVATAIAVLAAVASATFTWFQHERLQAALDRLATTVPAVPVADSPAARAVVPPPATPATPATPAAPARAAPIARPAAESLDVLPVPYGEAPLAGPRLARLASLLGELEARGARGVVTISWHAGDYCLTGNPAEGYLLAPDEMPADRCDLVGNPLADGLRPAQREPEAFAALVAATRARSGGALDVRVVDAGRRSASASYPDAGSASAAQWNTAAAANQRLEIALQPAART